MLKIAQKRASIFSVLSVILVVLATLGLMGGMSNQPAGAQAPLVSCVYHEHPSHVVCIVGGVVVLDVPVPVPTVTISLPPIRIPGPTRTVTVRPPAITLPGQPGHTKTIRVTQPGATKTVGVAPPTKTATAHSTKTVSGPSGQSTTSRATVTPSPEVRTKFLPGETRNKTETIVRYVALGTLLSLVLAALGILLAFLGYILGHKDAERQEKDFLGGVLRELRRGKHS
jgi:hypothetical protein